MRDGGLGERAERRGEIRDRARFNDCERKLHAGEGRGGRRSEAYGFVHDQRNIERHVAFDESSLSFAVARGLRLPDWVGGLIARKPFKVVAVALANKTARIIWALLTKTGVY